MLSKKHMLSLNLYFTNSYLCLKKVFPWSQKGKKKKAKRKFRIIRVKYGYLNGNNLAFIIDNILLLLQNKQH